MDRTRVERKRTQSSVRITEPLPRPPESGAEPGAREVRRPGALGFPERVALFAHALNRERTAALLEGFATREREVATACAATLEKLPSSERQGRLTAEFGIRADAGWRLRLVWAEAGPALRAEMFRLLPPYLKTLFPDFVPGPPAEPPPPAVQAFAWRLVREATR